MGTGGLIGEVDLIAFSDCNAARRSRISGFRLSWFLRIGWLLVRLKLKLATTKVARLTVHML